MSERRSRLTRQSAAATMNAINRVIPTIPPPFVGIRKRCLKCEAGFWTMGGYRGHYALVHILGMCKA